jgi:hypothetical protein
MATSPRRPLFDTQSQSNAAIRGAVAAGSLAAPTSTTGGAAPSGAAPANTVRSKMSAIGDRIGAGIRAAMPSRGPSVPGMTAIERPMTDADSRQFGMSKQPPSVPGMTATERPMTGGEARQFGLGGRRSLGEFARDAGRGIRGALTSPTSLLGAGAALGGAALSNTDLKQPTAQISTADYLNMPPEQIKALTEASSNESAGSAVEIDAARGAAAVPVPAVSPRAAVPLGGGAGRGNPENPLRTDRDPTSQAFGASRDFTPDLAGVPRELPGDLRDGVIFKTKDANGRTVYSGRNVGADAQMVDGMGRGQTGGGTVSTVPGMSRQEIDSILGRGAAAPAGGSGPSTPSLDGLVASSGLLATPKARRAAVATQQASEQLANQRRGQDITRDTSMAELAERRAEREGKAASDAATTARRAQFMQAAGGDPALASKLALQAGDTASADLLSGSADSQDSRAKTRGAVVEDFLKPLSTAMDEDGKGRVDDAMLQKNRAIVESLAQTQGISVEELLADAPSARAAVKIINGINATRKNTIGKYIGLDSAAEMTQLPNAEGARQSNVGFIRGALTPGASRGDRRFQTEQGDFYIPEDVWANEDVQRLMASRTRTN